VTRADLAALLSAIAGDRRAFERHAALALRLGDRLDEEVAHLAFAASSR